MMWRCWGDPHPQPLPDKRGEERGNMKNDFPRVKVSSEIKRKTVETARQFRKEPTRSEHILWQALRGKKLDGIKFRRQQPR